MHLMVTLNTRHTFLVLRRILGVGAAVDDFGRPVDFGWLCEGGA